MKKTIALLLFTTFGYSQTYTPVRSTLHDNIKLKTPPTVFGETKYLVRNSSTGQVSEQTPLSVPDASEKVAGKVSVGTQTFGGNKTIVGESATVGNALTVQNISHLKSLEIANSNESGVRSILRILTSEMYVKGITGGMAFAGVDNTSTVPGYPKKFSFGNDNLWNIETEYYAGYGIAFVNRFGGKTFATATLYLGSQGSVADNVGIGTTNPVAKLQVDSTTKGFAPPRMTTAQKNAIVTPIAGLMVFDTTLMKLCIFTTVWETITSI